MPRYVKVWKASEVKAWITNRPETAQQIATAMGVSLRTLYNFMYRGAPHYFHLACKMYELENPAREVRLAYMTPEEREEARRKIL